MDSCIYDRFKQCFRDCPNCPQSDVPEPDWDMLRDLENEDKERV